MLLISKEKFFIIEHIRCRLHTTDGLSLMVLRCAASITKSEEFSLRAPKKKKSGVEGSGGGERRVQGGGGEERRRRKGEREEEEEDEKEEEEKGKMSGYVRSN